MKRDSKLSSVLHVLLHLAHSERPMTSEQMAAMLGTNPVLVRRVLAGLRVEPEHATRASRCTPDA